MPNAFRTALVLVAGTAAAALVGACTVHDQSAPPLSGPSGLGQSLTVTASPSSLTQDGVSRSTITVVARDNYKQQPVSGLVIGLSMTANGQAQDYGSLSSKTIYTDSSGTATAIYTAPPPLPTGSATPTCQPTPSSAVVAGQCVNIVAAPSQTGANANFQDTMTSSATLLLVPSGVVSQPPMTPFASFLYSPTPVYVGISTIFDASASCGTQLQGSTCPPPPAGGNITGYNWTFGDGGSSTGRTITHTYAVPGTYSVTLTVTNGSGGYNQTTQNVTVALGNPIPLITFSPTAPKANQLVTFDGSGTQTFGGATIQSYQWSFGDGTNGSGVQVQHSYSVGNSSSYVVTLTVTDSAGRVGQATATITVQ